MTATARHVVAVVWPVAVTGMPATVVTFLVMAPAFLAMVIGGVVVRSRVPA